MAVVAVWKCDRDGKMFSDKKDAEEYDKMLELAANIAQFIEQHIPKIDESISEEIGILLAKHRETLAKACKGKPELLLGTETAKVENVTPLVASQ
ncbi:MAG: dsDNA-binding SOS-regulon protein [Cellvibrionaceae bacterium]|jgi:dsDNA-binding SOS-regulon protein